MAESLAIAGTCIGLISTIGTLSTNIHSFVSRARDAHRDLDAVLKELSSLGLCLETLRNDAMVTSKRVPPAVEHRVLLVLVNTAEVVQNMREMLDELSSDKFGNKMRWAIHGQADMNKLRSRLEAHKASLEIALALLTLSLTTAIKDDTSSIRRNIKGNVMTLEQITETLTVLPERIALQLQGQSLRLNIVPDTITAAAPPLLAPAAPTVDSARTLENLFLPLAIGEHETSATSPPIATSNQIDGTLDPVDVEGGTSFDHGLGRRHKGPLKEAYNTLKAASGSGALADTAPPPRRKMRLRMNPDSDLDLPRHKRREAAVSVGKDNTTVKMSTTPSVEIAEDQERKRGTIRPQPNRSDFDWLNDLVSRKTRKEPGSSKERPGPPRPAKVNMHESKDPSQPVKGKVPFLSTFPDTRRPFYSPSAPIGMKALGERFHDVAQKDQIREGAIASTASSNPFEFSEPDEPPPWWEEPWGGKGEKKETSGPSLVNGEQTKWTEEIKASEEQEEVPTEFPGGLPSLPPLPPKPGSGGQRLGVETDQKLWQKAQRRRPIRVCS